MSTHNIGFYEDLTKIIFELSSNIIKYAPYFFCCCLDLADAQADLPSLGAQAFLLILLCCNFCLMHNALFQYIATLFNVIYVK